MLLYEFNSLNAQDKAEYVWQNGKHLVSLRESESSYVLYQTPNFYVEMEITSELRYYMRAFKKGPLLDRYIDRVNLEGLS